MKTIVSLCGAIVFITLLSSCGFTLRGDYLIPLELKSLKLSSTDKYGELTRLVRQQLIANNVTLLDSVDVNSPELKITEDSLNRRTLSLFENGQVAEYELIYGVKYQLQFPNEDVKTFAFELNRDYQDDPDRALAKSRELNLILSELRLQAADKILRDLASIQR